MTIRKMVVRSAALAFAGALAMVLFAGTALASTSHKVAAPTLTAQTLSVHSDSQGLWADGVVWLKGGFAVTFSSGPHEGAGGNSVVCNGVPSKPLLIYYAKGGVDNCGHRDIKAIWLHLGITLKEVQHAKSEEVCTSNGNWQSSGRQHSLTPSMDHQVFIGGSKFYVRPLSAWGPGCYPAWGGTREDGSRWAVLKGCGNGETTHVPPKPKPPKRPVVPKIKKPGTPPSTCVNGSVNQSGNNNVVGCGKCIGNNVCNTTTPPPSPATFSATATATASASATATVNCPSGSASATATASASASGSGSGTAASTISQQDAQNKAQSVANANAQTNAQANAQASASATASGKCIAAPTPTASVSFNEVQEVNTNESRQNTCAYVTVSETMTVLYTADHGSWGGVSPTTVSGTQLVCGTYTGPSEPGTDIWHVQVFDNGKLIGDFTHPIQIVAPDNNPPPPPPGS